MDTIIEQLTTIIADKLDANINRDEITPGVPLFEDGLGLDSIMLVELISLVEENFGFRFAEDELDLKTFANLNTLAAFVATKQGNLEVGSWKLDRIQSPISNLQSPAK